LGDKTQGTVGCSTSTDKLCCEINSVFLVGSLVRWFVGTTSKHTQKHTYTHSFFNFIPHRYACGPPPINTHGHKLTAVTVGSLCSIYTIISPKGSHTSSKINLKISLYIVHGYRELHSSQYGSLKLNSSQLPLVNLMERETEMLSVTLQIVELMSSHC
jgi:hypothetical protein